MAEDFFQATPERICRRLRIDDPRFVEIESKKRVSPEDAKDLRKFLLKRRKVRHEKSSFFFDQFLDTPAMDLFRLGASLRLRYKRSGSHVYLQYKGPGFKQRGVLFRSEFSTKRLRHVLLEESHHDIVHFTDASVRQLMRRHVPPEMAAAMRTHLGGKTIDRIASGPILCVYQKDKFLVDLGKAFLEPSLDKVFSFHINRRGLHSLSSFCEYENEIKSVGESLEVKIRRLPDLLKFDARVSEKFDLRTERLDKYHRCASFFFSSRKS